MEAGCVVAAVMENAASGPQGEPGSGDVLEGDVFPSADLDPDDALPQAASVNPSGDKQQTSTAMMRSDDITELPAEPLLRSCVSTASMKVKNMQKLTFPRGHFPRLAECAHFHYENVDFGSVQLVFAEGQNEAQKAGLESKELLFLIQITCQNGTWMVKRSYEDFRVLDKHLHLCIYDRRYSQLTELPRYDALQDTAESITKMLATYLSRFSTIADNKINCGPILTWMEIDNKGNHLLVSEEASINVPAIAAAHVTKRYTAQAADELTFEVGDIVSVIDMPPKEDTGWWRGKHGFQVGFFPCDCVELINDKIPPSVQNSVPKPVCKKHGKLVTFLRSFMKSRPPPQKLRQRGILRERVFSCDLGEHLHNSGHEVPQVVRSCAEFIEKNGVVDGIYRLSGISSNIQKLRHEFDSEQIPDLTRDVFRQDIHSVGSLCKLYFRELPNPLLTYQLYDRFSEAVSAATDEERLVKIHNVIQQLPPPHYRTLEFLMRHLSHLATFSCVTNMHTKNLAIVWAPNLLRSKQIESACFSGTAAFMEVRIQSVVVEFILNNTEALFSTKLNAIIRESTGNSTLARPKSLLICSPSTKLLSLEEAQARTQAQLSSPATTPCFSHSDYIEVGEGPGALLGKFHTVIELPLDNSSSSKRAPTKAKKSPVGNWFSFFHLGKYNSVAKRKLKRHPSEPNEIKSIALPGGRGDSGTLRSTKSEESLTSLHNIQGEPSRYRPLRPRSISEAVSKDDVRVSRSKDDVRMLHPADGRNDSDRLQGADSPLPPHQEDDLDLCPPAAGIYSLDFDPMSYQCSPPLATSPQQRGKDGNKWTKSAGCSTDSEPVSSPNNNNNVSYPQSPDISPLLGKGKKKGSSKALSPKLRKKSFKTQADVQVASASTPIRGATSAPCPSSSPPADGKQSRVPFQHGSPLSTASQASAPTDLSQSAQNLPDPGTDRLLSSVSVLPPHPPLTSAARKLALALAESAQKAAHESQWRNTHVNIPFHPLQRQDAPHGRDRPPRPSILDLSRTHPQEYCRPHAVPVSQWAPLETHCCPHPLHFLPAHLSSKPSQLADGQESVGNYTPNVSPLGSGSFDEGSAEMKDGREEKEQPLRGARQNNMQTDPAYQSAGVSAPNQAVCSPLSPSTSPVYVNTDALNVFNFRAVLAETSMPPSLEKLLPHAFEPTLASPYSPEDLIEDVYSNHHHRPVDAGRMPVPHCPQPGAQQHHLKNVYRQSSEKCYSSLGLCHPLSPQCRRYPRDAHLISGSHRQQGQWRPSGDRIVGQPAIRRARSFHAPQISHHELAETEISPPNTMFYCEQSSSQDGAYQRLVQTGLHPVRPQFDDTCADYQCSDLGLVEGSCWYVAPWQRGGIRHSQSYTSRSTRTRGQMDYYNYSPHRVPPVNRETYIGANMGDYNADVYERAVHQPVKNECRRKLTRTAASPYESPVSPPGSKGKEAMHTRSMSDPGDACLLSTERAESQNVVVVTSPTSSRSRQANAEVIRRPIGLRSTGALGPSRRIQIKDDSSQPHRAQQQPPLRKVPSLPERSSTNRKNVEHNDRSHTRSQDQERLIAANAAGSYAGISKSGIHRKTGRSQSTRDSRHCYHYNAKSPLDPEHLESFSSQPSRRTRSAKVKPTQNDHMEGYYTAAKPKATRSGKAAAGYLPGPSYMSPHRQRLLSRALGHEAFYQAALRSDAGVFK